MIKFEVESSSFKVEGELTKEEYLKLVKEMNDTIKNIRQAVYPLFLGGKVLKYEIIIALIGLIASYIFNTDLFIKLVLVEVIAYLTLTIITCEHLSRGIQKDLKRQLQEFKKKYQFLLKQPQ